MKKAKIRLLFIEDNPGDVDLFREYLSEERDPAFELVHASYLKEGLEWIGKGGFDAILLDLALPDSFGFKTFTSVQDVAEGTPIVVLTIHDDMQMALAAVRRGAQDYIIKGRTDRALLSRVIHYAISRTQADADQRFLTHAGMELASSIDYEKTLTNVARLIVPRLADTCLIDLKRENEKIELVAFAHSNARKEKELRELTNQIPLEPGNPHGVMHVLETGDSELYPILSDVEWVATKLNAEYPLRLRKLNAQSYMCVPLRARDRVFGAITFLISESKRRYTSRDLSLAEELARRAAMAVDNARLFQATQHALRSREDLLAFVSHDLLNPLTSIHTNAQLIQRAKVLENETAEPIRIKARSIQRAASRMNNLIGSLMDLASIEAGRLKVSKAEHGVRALVQEAADMLRPLAEAKGVELDVEKIDLHEMIECDRDRMIQVFSNLVGNAIKFTDAGGKISIRVECSEKEVRFSVIDTGQGIPPDQLPRVFERYWQAKTGTKSGAGLGLYISKGIIDSHEGKIWAESTPAGAAFRFTLPRGSAAPGAGEINQA